MGLFNGLRKRSNWSLQKVLTDWPLQSSAQLDGMLLEKSSLETPGLTASECIIWNKVDLSDEFDNIGIIADDSSGFSSIDDSSAFSATLVGTTANLGKIGFNLGPSSGNNCCSLVNRVIVPPSNRCDYLYVLAISVGASAFSVTINYTDESHTTIDQQVSDWEFFEEFDNEIRVFITSYRNRNDGSKDFGTHLSMYCYIFPVNREKTIENIHFNGSSSVYMFAMTQGSKVQNLNCWLKADSIAETEDGDSFAHWRDSTRSNKHTEYAIETAPIYKTNILNGYPVLRFNGDAALTIQVSAPLKNYSVFSVFKSSQPHTFMAAISWGSGGPGTVWQGYTSDDANALNVGSDSSGDIVILDVSSDTLWHLAEYIHAGNNNYGYEKGEYISGPPATYGRTSNNLYIGSYVNSLYWQGDIAEVLVFKMSVNATVRKLVEQYLIGKYGLLSGIQYLLETEAEDFYIGYEPEYITTEESEDQTYMFRTEYGLVAYWNFDGTDGITAFDSTDDHNDGTYYGSYIISSEDNAPTNFSNGRNLQLDGNGYVRVPEKSSLDIIGGHISFGGWIKPVESGDNYQFVVGKIIGDGSGESRQYALFLHPSTNLIYIALQGIYEGDIGISSPWQTGVWNHIFVVYDTPSLIIYLNGSIVFNSVIGGTNIIHTDSDVWIGSEGGNLYNFFGNIDDIRVYDKSLSPDEVATLANGDELSDIADGAFLIAYEPVVIETEA